MSGSNFRGRITSGIALNAAALRTLEFIEANLPAWRDDPDRSRVERERELNSGLCKFLNVVARKKNFAMVQFHHEEPQGVHHSADISAIPVDADWIEGRQFTKYEPFLLVEGKRLPTPGSGRGREYITSAVGKKPMGGVQRFKLGLHGATLSILGMIAYIQERSCVHWFAEVNKWIDELAASGDPLWSSNDRLDQFVPNLRTRVSRCESNHSRRSGASAKISHLWMEM